MVKIAWRLSRVFMEKTGHIKLPEWLVWRLYGDSVECVTFYGDFMVKLVWRLCRVFMEKHGKSNHQTISMCDWKLVFTRKWSLWAITVSILSCQ